jgi:hypothetical protein
MSIRKTSRVLLSSLAIVFSAACIFLGETVATTTPDLNLVATLASLQGTQTALASAPTATLPPSITPPPPPATTPANPPAQFGSLSGHLSYPSEAIPPLRVVAFNVNTDQYYFVETTQNQSVYRFENLPPGVYQVVAYVLDGTLSGGYSQAVPCGMAANCSDHTLINVQVNAGAETTGIDPGDWYAPPGAFPPDPSAPAPAFGSISGQLSYPSEGIPPLRVVAFNLGTGQYYFIDTVQNQGSYKIENLPAGIYHVVAYVPGNDNSGGYSQAVPCGLSVACSNHSLIDVQVFPGQESTGVNPGDWYAPPGSFPPNPT